MGWDDVVSALVGALIFALVWETAWSRINPRGDSE